MPRSYRSNSLSRLDLLRALLCGCQPVQAAAHIHGEDHRDLQGEEAARGSSPRVRHHRHRLQVGDSPGAEISTINGVNDL